MFFKTLKQDRGNGEETTTHLNIKNHFRCYKLSKHLQ